MRTDPGNAAATCPARGTGTGAVARPGIVTALLLLTAVACAPLPVTPPVTAPANRPTATPAVGPQRVRLDTAAVCYACFWSGLEPGAPQAYADVLRQRRSADLLIAAELQLIVGRVTADSKAVCAAASAYAALAQNEPEPTRRLLAQETVAFTAAECGRSPAGQFRAAASMARDHGLLHKADVYDALAADTLRPLLQPSPVVRRLETPPGTVAYILGASVIRVDAATIVVSQVERVARDWLSFQLDYDFVHAPTTDRMLAYHEGARLRDVLTATAARLLPASGTLAIQVGGRSFAADGNGAFRFEVLPDKVQYPTTRSWHGVHLLVDTHGISSLVDAAVREHADLVVGCGDYTGKMEAAAYLAAKGVDVYFPTDRFVGEVLGYQGTGTLLGSAPVRREGHSAIIGDRPVTFRIAETVVVQRTERRGELQYYDAPARYFERLAASLPLRLEFVTVDAAGQAEHVIARARELGAPVVAIRIWTEADYAPVRAWLAESGANRAVLFHSVAYPAGERLFREFPQQTTFGDPRPLFLGQ